MDLSQLSIDDLTALKTGDLTRVSSAGLKYLKTAKTAETIDNDAISQGAKNFNANDSFGSNVLAGIGRGMTSMGRGVAQGAGMVADAVAAPAVTLSTLITGKTGPKPSDSLGLTTQADVDEAKKLDAPLMRTGGGKVGDVIGKTAIAAPTAFIPGANTALGVTAIGAGLGAATTEGNAQERALGAVEGALGGRLGHEVGNFAAAAKGAIQAKGAATAAANAGRDATVATAKGAGYVLPPTEVNPSVVNSLLEGLSGKVKTSQAASGKNQPITNALAKKELGAAPDAPLSMDVLNGIRQKAGAAYDAVSNAGVVTPAKSYDAALDAIVAPFQKAAQGFPNAKPSPIVAEIEALRSPQFDAGSGVAKIKELRGQADAAYAAGQKDVGRALKAGADAIEGAIDTHLVQTGAPADVLKNFRDARQLIAKTYSVQKAMNPTTGDVSASVLGNQLAKGRPLSGELKTIAEVAQAFPKATQSLKQNVNAYSPLDFAVGGLGAGGGSMLPALAMAARPGVRAGILSKPFQNRLAPSYDAPALLNLLAQNRALPVLGMATSE